MKYIGAHVSIQGGIFNAPINAKKIGATAFACFTKNQRRWFSDPYNTTDITKFKQALKKTNIDPTKVLPHDSYLINLGHPDIKKCQVSINALIDEITRASQLGLKLLNIHPGSHLKQISETQCLDNVIQSINIALNNTQNVTIVIENTAGQGGYIGYTFEQLAYLIKNITNKNRIGICIDTCHLFAAGYDIREKITYQNTWKEFEKIIGFNYLKGMHLNDCKSELGSRVDRHESLGKGQIGIDTFKFIMQDTRFDNMPLILETIDPTIWPEEIKLLSSFTK